MTKRTGGLSQSHIKRLTRITKKLNTLRGKGWNMDNHPDIEILHKEIDDIMKKRKVEEDAPTVAVAQGAVDGIGVGDKGEPGVSRKAHLKHKMRNMIRRKLRND